MHVYVVTVYLLQKRWRDDAFGCGSVSAHVEGNNKWTASEQVWMKLVPTRSGVLVMYLLVQYLLLVTLCQQCTCVHML